MPRHLPSRTGGSLLRCDGTITGSHPGNGERGVIRGSVNTKGADFGLHGQPSTQQVGSAQLGNAAPLSAQAFAQSSLERSVISMSSLLCVPQLILSNWSIFAWFTDSTPVQTLHYPPHTNSDIHK